MGGAKSKDVLCRSQHIKYLFTLELAKIFMNLELFFFYHHKLQCILQFYETDYHKAV